MKNIAVLVSGGGTNLQALIDAQGRGELINGRITAVISSTPGAYALERAKAAAHKLGVNPGIDPFMTLSFMALPVIPSLRITTRGVFDVSSQRYI